MRVILFNVGHGFCAFVKSESGSTLLIDCGCSENFSPVKYIVENELDGVVPINGKYLTELIVTHPHDDHIKDISRLIQLLPPYLLLRTKFKWEDVKTPNTDESEYENLNEYAEWQESYSAAPVQAPDWGKVSIQTFKVPQLLVSGSNNSKAVNNSSYAVVVKYTGSIWTPKFLFGGDLEESGCHGGRLDFASRLERLHLFNEQNIRHRIDTTSCFRVRRWSHRSGTGRHIDQASYGETFPL